MGYEVIPGERKQGRSYGVGKEIEKSFERKVTSIRE